MRAAIISLLLLAALPLFADFRLEPTRPTSHTTVVLQVRDEWRDGCLPFNPQVTRSGNTVEVTFGLPGGGCPQIVTEWIADVPLGTFAPGQCEVVVRVDREYARLVLVVNEPLPLFDVQPRVLSSAVANEVKIAGREICFGGSSQTQYVVTVDGVTVPSRVEQCALIATFPAHAPGVATVVVRRGQQEYRVVAAVRYVDPAATPDPSLFERVLVPVLFNGPGAFGSQWATEVQMINRAEGTLRWIPNASAPLPAVASNATTSLTTLGNRPSGLLLFLPRDHEVTFGSVFRDLSRDATQWGTELPVVREHELQDESVVLLNVPFDPRYRLQLRVYGVDGVSFGANVSVARENVNRTALVNVTGPCNGDQQPCNSNQPAFGTVDLTQAFPGLTGRHQVTVSTSPSGSRRLWAFITVTNNESQHVTTITPQ